MGALCRGSVNLALYVAEEDFEGVVARAKGYEILLLTELGKLRGGSKLDACHEGRVGVEVGGSGSQTSACK